MSRGGFSGSITITERDCEIDANILLIAGLPVDDVLDSDGPEVARFVVVTVGTFDVMKGEVVFTGGCNGCAAEPESKHASSFISVFCLTVALANHTEETTSLAPPSRYENTSAPPIRKSNNCNEGTAKYDERYIK